MASTPTSAGDQRIEAGGSLIFETAPLDERHGDPGPAAARGCVVAADRPKAMVAATLCDVAPDGAATRVSYGLLNLTHRDGHAEPAALEPGRAYAVRVQLNECGQRFAAGHRVRLALSTVLLAGRLARRPSP